MRGLVLSAPWPSPSGEEIILDIDSIDHPTRGQQPLAFYSRFYPLPLFDGQRGMLLASRLRPSERTLPVGTGS